MSDHQSSPSLDLTMTPKLAIQDGVLVIVAADLATTSGVGVGSVGITDPIPVLDLRGLPEIPTSGKSAAVQRVQAEISARNDQTPRGDAIRARTDAAMDYLALEEIRPRHAALVEAAFVAGWEARGEEGHA